MTTTPSPFDPDMLQLNGIQVLQPEPDIWFATASGIVGEDEATEWDAVVSAVRARFEHEVKAARADMDLAFRTLGIVREL